MKRTTERVDLEAETFSRPLYGLDLHIGLSDPTDESVGYCQSSVARTGRITFVQLWPLSLVRIGLVPTDEPQYYRPRLKGADHPHWFGHTRAAARCGQHGPPTQMLCLLQ